MFRLRFAPLREQLCRELAISQPFGLHHHQPPREWLDGVSDALCILPARRRDYAPSLLQHMRKAIIQGLAAFVLGTVTLAVPAASPNGEDIVVRVQKAGAGLDVYAELTVAASADETWEVLTDYDRMAQILSNVDASRILKREGHRLEVAQTNHIGFGPLRLTLNNLRRIELVPEREIRSHLIQGDLKASDFTTRLIEEGAKTRVIWRGRIVPGILTSLAVTADAVEAELRQLCRELRAEILRRKAGPSVPPCRLGKTCD